MDKKHRKKFADVKNTLKRIFSMKIMFPEIMYKQVTWVCQKYKNIYVIDTRLIRHQYVPYAPMYLYPHQ